MSHELPSSVTHCPGVGKKRAEDANPILDLHCKPSMKMSPAGCTSEKHSAEGECTGPTSFNVGTSVVATPGVTVCCCTFVTTNHIVGAKGSISVTMVVETKITPILC